MKATILAALTLLLSVTFALAPFVTSPFEGFDGAQLPIPQDSPPIEPAGYAFAIWGLIYAWLVLSAAFGWRARREDPAWRVPRIWLILSLLVGTPWLWIAGQSAIWATATIFLMAGAAVMALKAAPWFDRWMVQRPVGIYAGWLTAASFVSLGSTLAGYGLIGPGPAAWIGIAAALGTAGAVQLWLGKAPEYGLTVIWALVAVVVQNAGGNPSLAVFAGAGALVMALLAARAWTLSRAPLPAA